MHTLEHIYSHIILSSDEHVFRYNKGLDLAHPDTACYPLAGSKRHWGRLAKNDVAGYIDSIKRVC